MSATLSVVIISHNQAENLEQALLSTRWATERIVLELGSTDESLAVAKRSRATVLRQWGKNPLLQLENSLKAAKSDWILWLQAEECVDEALKREIQLAMGQGGANGYRVNRLQTFQGMPLKMNPVEPSLRLVRQGSWTVEAGWQPKIKLQEGETSTLLAPLHVKPMKTATALLESINAESTQAAYQRISTHGNLAGSGNLTWAVCRVPIHFVGSLIFRGAASQGAEGYLLNFLQALTPALTLSKIRQLLSAR